MREKCRFLSGSLFNCEQSLLNHLDLQYILFHDLTHQQKQIHHVNFTVIFNLNFKNYLWPPTLLLCQWCDVTCLQILSCLTLWPNKLIVTLFLIIQAKYLCTYGRAKIYVLLTAVFSVGEPSYNPVLKHYLKRDILPHQATICQGSGR